MDSDNIIFHLKRKKKILQEKINNYDKKKSNKSDIRSNKGEQRNKLKKKCITFFFYCFKVKKW